MSSSSIYLYLNSLYLHNRSSIDISLIMASSGCTINDYITVICCVGGFIISEILPHCPGIEANGILHAFTLFIKYLSESQCNKPAVAITNETPK